MPPQPIERFSAWFLGLSCRDPDDSTEPQWPLPVLRGEQSTTKRCCRAQVSPRLDNLGRDPTATRGRAMSCARSEVGSQPTRWIGRSTPGALPAPVQRLGIALVLLLVVRLGIVFLLQDPPSLRRALPRPPSREAEDARERGWSPPIAGSPGRSARLWSRPAPFRSTRSLPPGVSWLPSVNASPSFSTDCRRRAWPPVGSLLCRSRAELPASMRRVARWCGSGPTSRVGRSAWTSRSLLCIRRPDRSTQSTPGRAPRGGRRP